MSLSVCRTRPGFGRRSSNSGAAFNGEGMEVTESIGAGIRGLCDHAINNSTPGSDPWMMCVVHSGGASSFAMSFAGAALWRFVGVAKKQGSTQTCYGAWNFPGGVPGPQNSNLSTRTWWPTADAGSQGAVSTGHQETP